MDILELMRDYSVEEDYIIFDTDDGKEEVKNIFLEIFEEFKYIEKSKTIEASSILVGIGRGYKNIPDIKDIEYIANRLNAHIVGTRPLQDKGILDEKFVLGKTAMSASPKIYIAFGISGSIQHLGAIKTQGIVAINNNKNSGIFRHAKYKILGDAGKVAEYIRKVLKNGVVEK